MRVKLILLFVLLSFSALLFSQTNYVGTDRCLTCHSYVKHVWLAMLVMDHLQV